LDQPARDRRAGLDSGTLHEEADERAADFEAFEDRRRSEPDLPAERPVAGCQPLLA